MLGYFETAKSDYILDVFSRQDDWIKLIPFVARHKFRVPTTYNLENFKFPLFGDPQKYFSAKIKNFLVFLGIMVTT
jgi:hypothetical protein